MLKAKRGVMAAITAVGATVVLQAACSGAPPPSNGISEHDPCAEQQVIHLNFFSDRLYKPGEVPNPKNLNFPPGSWKNNPDEPLESPAGTQCMGFPGLSETHPRRHPYHRRQGDHRRQSGIMSP
jgi:hypothetical protein